MGVTEEKSPSASSLLHEEEEDEEEVSGANAEQLPFNGDAAIRSTLSPSTQRAVQNFSLTFLTLQQSLNPIMVRWAHAMAAESREQFLGSTTVFTTELLRIVMCCGILRLSNDSFHGVVEELWNTFFHNKKETIKMCIPALIYVIQNNLYFFALQRVEATLFSITYQLRILTTALLSVLLLRRVLSRMQWGALFVSLVGVVLVQFANARGRQPRVAVDSSIGGIGNDTQMAMTGGVEEQRRHEFVGLVAVLVMCWSSAFAGVYLEGVLKRSGCNIWLQNIRLSVITLPFTILAMANDRDVIEEHGIYFGWNWLVWTIAFSSAMGGIVVAAALKYADNIKKSYCQSVALGGTAFLSILIGDSRFSFLLLGGVGLVIASVFLYTLNPARMPQGKMNYISSSSSSDSEGEQEEEEEEGEVENEEASRMPIPTLTLIQIEDPLQPPPSVAGEGAVHLDGPLLQPTDDVDEAEVGGGVIGGASRL